jgi:hypothetical protein
MVAAAMLLELHGCGIHAVWFGAGEASVTEVRFRSARLRYVHHDQLKPGGTGPELSP